MAFGALLGPLIATGLGDIGLGGLAATTFLGASVPEIAGGILGGAGLGAAEAGLTGGDPLMGALGGGVGGGVSGIAGPALESAGLGATAAGAVGGAAGGLTSSLVTGGNPLIGAATGAGGSLVGSALNLGGSTAAPAATGVGSGGAAASTAPVLGGPSGGGGGTGAAAMATPGGATLPATGMTGSDFGGGGDLGSGSTVPGTAAAAGAAGGTGTGTGGGNMGEFGEWSPRPSGGIGDAITGWLTKNPGVLLGGALLGGSMLFGNNQIPGLGAIEGQAAQETALGNEAMQGLKTGAVPAGAQALLDNLAGSMKAKVRSNYAQLGLSGSSSEAQDLAHVDQQVAGQKWNIINSLLGSGLQSMGLANTMDQAAMNAQIHQDEEMQGAIGRFAAALAGGFGHQAA